MGTGNILLDIVIGSVIVLEVWYWALYFPRAWRNGSNEEINNIKWYIEWKRKG